MDDSQLPRQRQNSTFGCGVCQLRSCRADQRNNGGSVDDGGLLLAVAAEGEDGVFAAVPDALDVDVVGEIPDSLGGVDGVRVLVLVSASVY